MRQPRPSACSTQRVSTDYESVAVYFLSAEERKVHEELVTSDAHRGDEGG
jgi:hypothetical protein